MSMLKISAATLVLATGMFLVRDWLPAPSSSSPPPGPGPGPGKSAQPVRTKAYAAAEAKRELAKQQAENELSKARSQFQIARNTLESARVEMEMAKARDRADYKRYMMQRDIAETAPVPIDVRPYDPGLKFAADQAEQKFGLARITFQAEEEKFKAAERDFRLAIHKADADFESSWRHADPNSAR